MTVNVRGITRLTSFGPLSSWVGVRGKEIPQNIPCRNTRIRIEVRVERDLPGNVHGDGVPGVYSSDQLVKLYFSVPAAIRGILLNLSADVSLTIAQGNRCVET
jgi:hypothetical protein